MADIEKMTTEEIFSEIKKSLNKVSVTDLTDYEKNLLIALGSAVKTEQRVLMEQCMFYHKCLKKENELINLGFDKFIYKDDLNHIIKELEASSENKNIYFISLDKFPRVIPTDVVKKIEKVKKQKIFDKYYILYTDYTKKTSEKSKSEYKKEKDPIVFGAFSESNKENTVHYMGERVYYIADWIDEYCDLTLDRLMSVVPDKVHSLYGINNIELKEIEKLKDSELGKILYTNIKKELDAKSESKNGLVKNIFDFLKKIFG